MTSCTGVEYRLPLRLLGARELPEPLVRVISVLAPAILATLVVVGGLSEGSRLSVDAQAAAVAVARGAYALRLPMLAAVALGAVTASALRGF